MREEYTYVRKQLVEFLQGVRGEDYDAVYYFVGKLDFNPFDQEAIEIIADAVLEKASAGKINPYKGDTSVESLQSCKDVPDFLIVERTKRESEARESGITYIPQAEKFRNIAISALAVLTPQQSARLDEDIRKYNSPTERFKRDLKRDLQDPVWLAILGLVILFGVISLFS